MLREAGLSVVTGSLLVLSSCISLSSWDLSDYKKLNSTHDQLHGHISEFSWIINLSLGLVLGATTAAFMINRVGRKLSLLVLAIPLSCSYLAMIFATNVVVLCIAAFVTSIVVGGSFTIIIVYTGELCPEKYRNVTLSFVNVVITSGTFFYYLISPYVSVSELNMVLLCFEIVTFVTFLFVGSESPYFYVAKGQFDTARATLRKIRHSGDEEIDKELDDIKQTVNFKLTDSLKKEINSKPVKTANFMVSNLLLLQQFSGVYGVLFYTQNFLQNTTTPELSAIIVSAIHLLSSFAIPALIASCSRKLLLIVSALAMSLSQASLGVHSYLNEHELDAGRVAFLPILALIVFSLAFNVGLGPVPWIFLSEVFPYSVKPGFVALNTGCAWMNKFMAINAYFQLSRSVGASWCFFLFSGLNLVAGIFAKFVVKDYSVKNVLEVQENFYQSKDVL